MNIVFRLGEIFKEKGRGVREVSRASGVDVTTISRIVNNHNHGISLDVLARLCKELSITPGELFEVTENEKDGKV